MVEAQRCLSPAKAKLWILKAQGNAWYMKQEAQGTRMLGKGQVCKACRDVNPGLQQNWGKIPRGAGPRGGLGPCVAKPKVGSPGGSPTHHGGSPAGAKQWILKAWVG
jgi:hypothetical protein